MSSPTVLVIRATGTQGRSVCRKSLEQGFNVNALVLDKKSERSIDLEKLGVTLFEGSIDDRASLDRALKGCRISHTSHSRRKKLKITGEHLFLTLMPRFDEDASELRQAKFIIAAAKAANVKYIVSSTVFNSEEDNASLNNPLFLKMKGVKLQVEEETRNAGFDAWTIVRPGYFMSNFLFPLGDVMFPELATEGKFVTALFPDTDVQLIDPDDIGGFSVAAFKEPKRFNGQVLTIASEKRKTTEIVNALEKASGKKIQAVWLDTKEADEKAKTNPIIAGQVITRSYGNLVDYGALKSWGVPLGTFEDYLHREQALVRKTFNKQGAKKMDLFESANKPS